MDAESSCRSYFLSFTIERQSGVTVGSRLARRRLTINGSTVNLGGLRWTSQKMCQFGVHKMGTMSGGICEISSGHLQ